MNNTKKILMISQEAPPMVGGAGVVGWQNAKRLCEVGNDVTFLTVSNEVLIDDDLDVVVTPRIPKFWLLFFITKIHGLLKKEFDIIIINDIGAALAFSMFLNDKSILRRTIVYLHGGEVKSIFKKTNILFEVFCFESRYTKLLKECKSIIAVSYYMKNYFLESTRIDAISEKIKVIYAGVDGYIFKPIEYDIYKQYSIDRDKKILLSVSRITKDKGYDVKFNVFKKLIENNSEFHWIVVGGGGYLDELKELSRANHLDDFITFLGPLERKELPVLYSSADVFWLLSNQEAFGLAYIEAQMCGTPAIGLNNSGVVESISNNVSGFLVKDEDECFNILSNKIFEKISFGAVIDFSKKFLLENQIVDLMRLMKK